MSTDNTDGEETTEDVAEIPDECQLCRPNGYRGDQINAPDGSVTVARDDGGPKFVYCCRRCAGETFSSEPGDSFTPIDTETAGTDSPSVYRTPGRGEDHAESDLPLGWLADRVDAPDDWTVSFVDRGGHLRFRRELSDSERDEYGVPKPGHPGVGITATRDSLTVLADTDRVLQDLTFVLNDDSEGSERTTDGRVRHAVWRHSTSDLGVVADDVVASVETAIETVQTDLERARLSNLLDGCVPESVVQNLIERFGTAERVLEIEADTPVLESVSGVGPKRRETIQDQLKRVKMRRSDGEADVTVETNRENRPASRDDSSEVL